LIKKNKQPCEPGSDEELLAQFIQTSNQEVLGQLYAQYIPLVYGLCLKYLQQTEDAEDAVHQIYEELTQKIHHYRIENFKTWLYSVAKNHCLQILRKNKHFLFEEIDGNVMELDTFEHLIDVNDDKEREDALNSCLDTLPAEQRQCITSFFFEDCSYADIVRQTGFALNKVKSYIQNGKRNLKICILKTINNEYAAQRVHTGK
jgi:RNA polymerase sigma-70 factor (ECF subfamily)